MGMWQESRGKGAGLLPFLPNCVETTGRLLALRAALAFQGFHLISHFLGTHPIPSHQEREKVLKVQALFGNQ